MVFDCPIWLIFLTCARDFQLLWQGNKKLQTLLFFVFDYPDG